MGQGKNKGKIKLFLQHSMSAKFMYLDCVWQAYTFNVIGTVSSGERAIGWWWWALSWLYDTYIYNGKLVAKSETIVLNLEQINMVMFYANEGCHKSIGEPQSTNRPTKKRWWRPPEKNSLDNSSFIFSCYFCGGSYNTLRSLNETLSFVFGVVLPFPVRPEWIAKFILLLFCVT